MALVTGVVGMSILAPSHSVTWEWEVPAGYVWQFWPDNTSLYYTATYVTISSLYTKRVANTQVASIRIYNGGNNTVGFLLRYARMK